MEEKVYGLQLCQEAPFGWRKVGGGDDATVSEERGDIIALLREDAPLKLPTSLSGFERKRTPFEGYYRRSGALGS